MLLINLDPENASVYAHSVYELFQDCARDLKLNTEITDYKFDGYMFGIPKEVFFRLLENWALQKYNMWFRFVHDEKNIVSQLQLGWEDLSDEECSVVFLQMYPEMVDGE